MTTVSKASAAVADRILELLDQGELPPWERSWSVANTTRSCNAVSGRPYRGINVWLTGMSQEAHGYDDHRWLTFNQARKSGGSVRKGEKSTRIIFWKMLESEDEETGKTIRRPMAATYNVFNVLQTENCDIPELEPEELAQPPDPIAQAEAIIAAMPKPPIF